MFAALPGYLHFPMKISSIIGFDHRVWKYCTTLRAGDLNHTDAQEEKLARHILSHPLTLPPSPTPPVVPPDQQGKGETNRASHLFLWRRAPDPHKPLEPPIRTIVVARLHFVPTGYRFWFGSALRSITLRYSSFHSTPSRALGGEPPDPPSPYPQGDSGCFAVVFF